jgi:nucleoside 2-deoxyribosyltransferase
MKLYLAGPLFTAAERGHLEQLARRLELVGHDCFVPHLRELDSLDSKTVYSIDSAGLREAEVLVAWLDGPMVDDGTACEIGIFSELVRANPDRHKGIVGLATDWRLSRRRDAGMRDGGINLFVVGAIHEHGQIVWSLDEAETALRDWSAE